MATRIRGKSKQTLMSLKIEAETSRSESRALANWATTARSCIRSVLFLIDKSSGTFRKPGWIVLFCLMAVCLGLLAVAGIHSQTRKKISRCCCGAYGELSTDADTTSVLVEGHHEESVTVEPISKYSNSHFFPRYRRQFRSALLGFWQNEKAEWSWIKIYVKQIIFYCVQFSFETDASLI